MLYLAIFLVVAMSGIGALWVYQRRQRAHLNSVDGFRSSLERVSQGPALRPRVSRVAPQTPRKTDGRPSLQPLDPVRREAARRRLEQRRAARAS